MRKSWFLAVVALLGIAPGLAAWGGFDFGVWRDLQLRIWSQALFGVKKPLRASSTASVDAGTAETEPRSLVTLAKGLRAHVATSSPDAGADIEMIARLVPCFEGNHCNGGFHTRSIGTSARQARLWTWRTDPVRPWHTARWWR